MQSAKGISITSIKLAAARLSGLFKAIGYNQSLQ
jgi:hypothetical protein